MRAPLRAKVAALIVAVALLAAACGGSGDSSEGQGSDVAADPNGVFRRAVNLTSTGGLNFDPATMGQGQYQWTYPVTNSLLKIAEDGSYEPDLAVSAEIVDPSTITVKMREGLTFSDGLPLTAQSVVDSVQRTKAAKPSGLRTAELNMISSMTASSPTDLTVKLSAPQAGAIFPLLADAEFTPVSPATAKVPGDHGRDVITAGPFRSASTSRVTGGEMVKNDLYWDAGSVQLAAIEYIHTDASAAAVNALRSGVVDYVSASGLLAYADSTSLAPPLEGTTRTVPAPYFVAMCIRSDNPLGNVKVRQALNYATDRDDINAKMYNGSSEIAAWGLAPSGNRVFNEDLVDSHPYDVTRHASSWPRPGTPTASR